jgi:hypothetical protein
MNESKAIESAMARMIRQHADIGEGVSIRAFRSLSEDAVTDMAHPDGDRATRIIDVRCSLPSFDAGQHAYAVECQIGIMTQADDDRNHAALAMIEDSVSALVTAMHREQFKAERPLESEFIGMVAADTAPAGIVYGGIVLPEGQPTPGTDGNYSTTGIIVSFRFARSD